MLDHIEGEIFVVKGVWSDSRTRRGLNGQGAVNHSFLGLVPEYYRQPTAGMGDLDANGVE